MSWITNAVDAKIKRKKICQNVPTNQSSLRKVRQNVIKRTCRKTQIYVNFIHKLFVNIFHREYIILSVYWLSIQFSASLEHILIYLWRRMQPSLMTLSIDVFWLPFHFTALHSDRLNLFFLLNHNSMAW